MQVVRYTAHDIDLLMRRQVEERLLNMHRRGQEENSWESALYDCKEFGMCLVSWSQQLQKWKTEWFRKEPFPKRTPRPRIAVTVNVLDGVTKNLRYRWQFAMSRLGFLYPVSYESQRIQNGVWVSFEEYYSWRKNSDTYPSKSYLPDDSICREAERLYKRKK